MTRPAAHAHTAIVRWNTEEADALINAGFRLLTVQPDGWALLTAPAHTDQPAARPTLAPCPFITEGCVGGWRCGPTCMLDGTLAGGRLDIPPRYRLTPEAAAAVTRATLSSEAEPYLTLTLDGYTLDLPPRPAEQPPTWPDPTTCPHPRCIVDADHITARVWHRCAAGDRWPIDGQAPCQHPATAKPTNANAQSGNPESTPAESNATPNTASGPTDTSPPDHG